MKSLLRNFYCASFITQFVSRLKFAVNHPHLNWNLYILYGNLIRAIHHWQWKSKWICRWICFLGYWHTWLVFIQCYRHTSIQATHKQNKTTKSSSRQSAYSRRVNRNKKNASWRDYLDVVEMARLLIVFFFLYSSFSSFNSWRLYLYICIQ